MDFFDHPCRRFCIRTDGVTCADDDCDFDLGIWRPAPVDQQSADFIAECDRIEAEELAKRRK